MQGNLHKASAVSEQDSGCMLGRSVASGRDWGSRALPFLKLLTSAVLLQILSELVESARSHNFTDLVMVHEHRGEPDGLVVCHLPYGPTAYFGIFNTVGLHFSRRALSVCWALPASATPELKCLLGLAQLVLGGRLPSGLPQQLSHLCLAVQPVWVGPALVTMLPCAFCARHSAKLHFTLAAHCIHTARLTVARADQQSMPSVQALLTQAQLGLVGSHVCLLCRDTQRLLKTVFILTSIAATCRCCAMTLAKRGRLAPSQRPTPTL